MAVREARFQRGTAVTELVVSLARGFLGSTPAFVVVLTFLVGGACAPSGSAGSAGASAAVSAPDPANATFQIERDRITLSGGRAEREAAPGSATKIVTTLAAQRATGDVDGDARPDTAVLLVQQPGGSGTFFYVAALLNPSSGAVATPAVLLGDRIAPTALRLEGTTIVVEFLDRAPGQPLSASPAVPTTKRFAVQAGALVAR